MAVHDPLQQKLETFRPSYDWILRTGIRGKGSVAHYCYHFSWMLRWCHYWIRRNETEISWLFIWGTFKFYKVTPSFNYSGFILNWANWMNIRWFDLGYYLVLAANCTRLKLEWEKNVSYLEEKKIMDLYLVTRQACHRNILWILKWTNLILSSFENSHLPALLQVWCLICVRGLLRVFIVVIQGCKSQSLSKRSQSHHCCVSSQDTLILPPATWPDLVPRRRNSAYSFSVV